MSSPISCVYTYLPIERHVVSKLHSKREIANIEKKENRKKLDTNNEFTLDRFKLVNKMT
jgi:hypothetical protein